VHIRHCLKSLVLADAGTGRRRSVTAGDVRRASVKRCASAVGEGAVSIPQVRAWLETLAVAQAGPGY
jgi:hypothetical protein